MSIGIIGAGGSMGCATALRFAAEGAVGENFRQLQAQPVGTWTAEVKYSG